MPPLDIRQRVVEIVSFRLCLSQHLAKARGLRMKRRQFRASRRQLFFEFSLQLDKGSVLFCQLIVARVQQTFGRLGDVFEALEFQLHVAESVLEKPAT